MATRRSMIGRTLDYIREGDLDEVKYVVQRATEILGQRRMAEGKPAPVKTRTRRAKVNGGPVAEPAQIVVGVRG